MDALSVFCGEGCCGEVREFCGSTTKIWGGVAGVVEESSCNRGGTDQRGWVGGEKGYRRRSDRAGERLGWCGVRSR